MGRTLLVIGLLVLFCSAGFSQAPVVAAWNVNFTFDGGTTIHQMRFVQLGDRTGIFRFPAATATERAAFPAVWDRPDPLFLAFSGEVQLGTDGPSRTLMFKSRIRSTARLTGAAIFASDIPAPPGGPSPFLMRFGTFTAVPANATTP
jgi:hypothetical protein